MSTNNIDYNNYKIDDFILDDSFINYATNSNGFDVKKWEQWFSENPENKQLAMYAKNIILHLRFNKKALPQSFVKAEWSKLARRLLLTENKFANKSRTSIRKLLPYAAAASILLFMAAAFYFYKPLSKQNKIISYQEIIVPKGEIKKVLLPDGSLVYINSDSRIKYDSCFSGKKREIFLEGEAYFDVKHNENKPFVVHANENDITVLGTSFNVYAYPNENIFRTSLERGKIALSHNNGKEIELKVNQTYLLLKNTNEIKLFETANIEDYSAWKDGKILFKNHKFTDILKKLERTHNLTFVLHNKDVGSCNYTGCFTTKDDINTILGVIKLPTPFEYEILEDTVVIK